MRLEDAIQVRVRDGQLVVSGDMDLATTPVLQKAVAKLGGKSIALDLSGVAFIDSTGLHLLLDLRREYGRLRLAGASPAVEKLLAITGTREFLFETE
jgi:anti-sigma B factor antagonist